MLIYCYYCGIQFSSLWEFFVNQGMVSIHTKVCISQLRGEALGGLKMTSPLNSFHLLCSSASVARTSFTPISSFLHFSAWQNGTPTHMYTRSFICILPKYQCGRTRLGTVEWNPLSRLPKVRFTALWKQSEFLMLKACCSFKGISTEKL